MKIRQLDYTEFSLAAKVICKSFATVANDFGLTKENCPKYVGFVTTTERLKAQYDGGWQMYGIYEDKRLVGYSSISKEADGVYEIHNLSVLPENRHMGYGKRLLEFCMEEIMNLGGRIVKISIVEENTILKNWYISYGFIHTGTKKYDHLPFTSGYMEKEVLSWESR